MGSPSGRLVSRNAATLPDGLIDAELFGNRAQYPNPGMPAREGLVGAADGGTLFLDEIGELPEAAQAHLLRVLDDGEYQRLGESEVRASRFRFIGATNRPLDQLKHDLLARLTLRIALPPLAERVEDLPLIARHLVLRATKDDAHLRAQFVQGEVPRLSPELLSMLVRRPFPHGVRELVAFLWSAMQSSPGEWVAVPPDEPRDVRPDVHVEGVDPDSLTVEAIQAVLEANDWVVARSWASLGLKSRHALNRLIKKHGLTRPE